MEEKKRDFEDEHFKVLAENKKGYCGLARKS